MTHTIKAGGIWLCGSCAGWYYDYCNPLSVYSDEYPDGATYFKDGTIVRCPCRHYHFIPTKHWHTLRDVMQAFPLEFLESSS